MLQKKLSIPLRTVFTSAIFTLTCIVASCTSEPSPAPNATAQLATAVAVVKTATAQAQPAATAIPSSAQLPSRTFTSGGTATTVPTKSPTPSGTRTPPLLQPPGFEKVTLRTVCLKVEQSYTNPTGEFSQPIAESAYRILTGIGLQVVTEGNPCDATLVVTLTSFAKGANYSGGRYCYSGAETRGKVTLSITGRSPLVVSANGDEIPAFRISYCPEKPGDAPFEKAWLGALLEGLGQLWGTSAPVQFLNDEQMWRREVAVDRLGKLGPPAIPFIIQALRDGHVLMQFQGYIALCTIGTAAVPILIQALSDTDEYVRWGASEALGCIRPPAKEAIPAVIQALGDNSSLVREETASALGGMGPEAKQAVSKLAHLLLNDPEDSVRQSVAFALGALKQEPDECVPALAQALGDKSKYVRRASVLALNDIGPKARVAVPALIKVLTEQDDELPKIAASALKNITAQDFGQDSTRWQQWWDQQK